VVVVLLVSCFDTIANKHPRGREREKEGGKESASSDATNHSFRRRRERERGTYGSDLGGRELGRKREMRLSVGEVRKRRRGGRRVGWKRELKSEGGEGRKEGKESEGESERERESSR